MAYALKQLQERSSSLELFLWEETAMPPVNDDAAGSSSGRDGLTGASMTKRNKPRCNLSPENQIHSVCLVFGLFFS